MSDWHIRKKEETCASCERPFEEGEAFFSVLSIRPEGLGREDRCPACFEQGFDPGNAPAEAAAASGGPGEEAVGLVFWRTRRLAEKRKGLAVDFDSIEQLFLALDGRPEERLLELRHLLGLLLLRKKRLKLLRIKRAPDGEFLILRRPRRTEEIEVQVFDLVPERTTILRADLERIFEGAGAEDLGELGPVEEESDAAAADPVESSEDAPADGEVPPPVGAPPVNDLKI